MNDEQIIKKTKIFLKDKFTENPHYSFNDWEIMYNHGLNVYDFALKISSEVGGDKLIISIGALLHDIGKTCQADEKTLYEKHGEFGYIASKDFLEGLGVDDARKAALKNILSGNGKTTLEKKVIEDADIIAFFADENLQRALDEWGRKNNRHDELKRKAGKINLLEFEVSKRIAKPLHQRMVEKWKLKSPTRHLN